MKEEQKENVEETEVVSKENLKKMKKQWVYITIYVGCVVAILVAYATAIITYTVMLKKDSSKIESSGADAKEDLKTIASDYESDDTEATALSAIEALDKATDTLKTVLETYAEFIDEKYYGEIDKDKLVESTIKGIVEGLDPEDYYNSLFSTDLIDSALKGLVEGIGDDYSEYMTAEEWAEYQESALGNYVGVGIYMKADKETGYILIDSTIKGSPAEKAKLQGGDYIVAVDGDDIKGRTASDVSSIVKGEEGTDVTLTIDRNGNKFDVTLTRAAITTYPITSEMEDETTGYIYLSSFNDDCAEEFEEEMDDLISQGATKIIFDLRYNTGGLVSEALSILDLFLDKGEVELITKSADGTEVITKSQTEKKYDVDLVILVNDYSASASEIVTGALKDQEIATIVGETTYGKGVIQNVYQLLDGSILKLTTQEYFTPDDNTINKIGITPDYEVEWTDEDLENGIDSQLEAAKSILNGTYEQ